MVVQSRGAVSQVKGGFVDSEQTWTGELLTCLSLT